MHGGVLKNITIKIFDKTLLAPTLCPIAKLFKSGAPNLCCEFLFSVSIFIFKDTSIKTSFNNAFYIMTLSIVTN